MSKINIGYYFYILFIIKNEKFLNSFFLENFIMNLQF